MCFNDILYDVRSTIHFLYCSYPYLWTQHTQHHSPTSPTSLKTNQTSWDSELFDPYLNTPNGGSLKWGGTRIDGWLMVNGEKHEYWNGWLRGTPIWKPPNGVPISTSHPERITTKLRSRGRIGWPMHQYHEATSFHGTGTQPAAKINGLMMIDLGLFVKIRHPQFQNIIIILAVNCHFDRYHLQTNPLVSGKHTGNSGVSISNKEGVVQIFPPSFHVV